MAKKPKPKPSSKPKYEYEDDMELPAIMHANHPAKIYPEDYEKVDLMPDGKHIKFKTEDDKNKFIGIGKAIEKKDPSRKFHIRSIDGKTSGIWRKDETKKRGWGGKRTKGSTKKSD